MLLLAVTALGVSAFLTQLVLMREMLSAFAGNELVFGIVLGGWLLLTGFGSQLGATTSRLRDPIGLLVAAQLIVAFWPPVATFLMRIVHTLVFVRGAEVGVAETFLSCLLLLAPYCLTAGYLLTLTCQLLAAGSEPSSIGRVYFLDNLGDILGGMLFTFVLVWLLDHMQILYLPAVLNLLLAAAVAWYFGRRALLVVVLVAGMIAAVVVVCWSPDEVSLRLQYPRQQVVYCGNSPYGRLVVTRADGQLNLIHSGVPLFSTGNIERVEETVHYAMAQRPQARRVLLISGGVSGTAREILRWGVSQVDYVELDPQIVRVTRRFVPDALGGPDDPIRVWLTDGRFFVRYRAARGSYDVAIVDVPDPSTSQLNRFYTREFFAELDRCLWPGGVVCIGLAHYESYLSPQLAELVAVLHRTLSEQYEHVLMIPAGRILFLASDRPLTTAIAERIEQKGIATQWVNRHQLRDVLHRLRMQAVQRAVRPDAPINSDLNPILYYYHLRYWMSQFRTRLGVVIGSLLIVLVLFVARATPVSLAIFTTGLAASALEVVLLVGFQVLYGSVYYQVGLIVTMFMVGLAAGSFSMNRVLARCTKRHLVQLEGAVAAFAALLPLVLMGLHRLEAGPVVATVSQLVIPLLALVLAMFVGLEFPLAAKVRFRSVAGTASELYSADYLGSALGAMLAGTLLIPVLGVVGVCLLVAAANLATALAVWLRG